MGKKSKNKAKLNKEKGFSHQQCRKIFNQEIAKGTPYPLEKCDCLHGLEEKVDNVQTELLESGPEKRRLNVRIGNTLKAISDYKELARRRLSGNNLCHVVDCKEKFAFEHHRCHKAGCDKKVHSCCVARMNLQGDELSMRYCSFQCKEEQEMAEGTYSPVRAPARCLCPYVDIVAHSSFASPLFVAYCLGGPFSLGSGAN